MIRSTVRAAALAGRRLAQQPAWERWTSSAAAAGRTTTRAFSEKASSGADGGKLRSVLEEAATMHAAPKGAATAEAADAAAEEGGIGAMIGNVLTIGGLAASAYFGYYTYKYTADEMDKRLDELSASGDSATKAWCSVMDQYMVLRRKSETWVKEYADPPTDKLLPDIPPNVIYPRYTVVLDLNETLVHSDWTRGRGWKVFKRPGVEDFLTRLSPQVELVLYTDQMATYGEPIMDRIDPQRNIRFRLYRDSTQYHNGKHVRDLSKLNRPLSQVIFISANPDAYLFQPDNTVKLEAWKAEEGDTALLDLLPFLELIVKTNVADVRDVMRSYAGQDIPTAFRKRMEELEQRRKAQPSSGFLGIQLR